MVDLTAGRAPRWSSSSPPSRPAISAFAAFRVGIGRPMGDAESPRRSRRRGRPRSRWSSSGAMANGTPRAATSRTSRCPGARTSSSQPSPRRTREPSWCCRPVGRSRCPGSARCRRCCRPGIRARSADNAIADVLIGAAEPGGRLPQTFPARWADNPTASRDPEVYPGLDGRVRYAEGVFVGYRHYDRAGIAPLFPFGHGLGYTLRTVRPGGCSARPGARASASVTNIGRRRGATVVQVWVGGGEPSAPRPVRELRAFEKLALNPGETRQLSFDLAARALTYYDVGRAAWLAEKGPIEIAVGFSAADFACASGADVVARAASCRRSQPAEHSTRTSSIPRGSPSGPIRSAQGSSASASDLLALPPCS